MKNFIILFLFLIFNINLSFGFYNPHRNLLKTNKSLMIDPTKMNDFTNALIVNGIGYTVLKESNQKSLNNSGLVHAAALGTGLMTFLGWKGYSLCLLFFVLGSSVTKLKINQKKCEGIAEKNNGARGPTNVWGSAAVAMIFAILSYLNKESSELFKLAYVTSISTKLTDTFQSEVGKAYGKNTFLMTNLQKVPRGTEGAISIEGTLAGILASIIINISAYKLGIIDENKEILISVVSSQVATFIESYIGAKYQKEFLNNELVNVINTLIGSLLSILFYKLL
tara:strand:+ start:1138 stop:1980 length:843 start_codon:yes stop_codon:yes gene_type:complete